MQTRLTHDIFQELQVLDELLTLTKSQLQTKRRI